MKENTATSIGASLQAIPAAAPAAPQRASPGPAATAREHRIAPSTHLTPRQLEVLALLCEGLPNKLICRRLNIATGTVKVHISCILRELGVTTRLQAVVSARKRGLPGELVARTPEPAAGTVSGARPARTDRSGKGAASGRDAMAA